MSKLKVLDKKSEKSINTEREFLSKLHNSFIVNMHYAFQDAENLYLVMDLMPGGDLRFHLSRHKRFSEEQTRFFICCIIIALEYIHSNNVIHRDIKPENLVLDENGYVRLTDFGIAKENKPDNKSETSGTPGYMSPEVMKSLNHSFPVDFFALGVIGYEFMKGERPYVGRNRKEIKEQILARQAELKLEDITEGWSKESADFINRALIRKPENRIGYKGIIELKKHPWLKYYPWEMLYQKNLPSPFIPENKDNFDRRYCESSDVIAEDTKLRYEEILMDDIYDIAFKNFYYNTDEVNKNKNDIVNSNNKDNNKSNNNSKSHKIIISNQKIITDINNNSLFSNNIVNNISNKNKKNENRNINFKNSMKIIPNSARNIINKNHKKTGGVINYNRNINNNVNTNVGSNVSNNVIYINFNINNQNLERNIYNNKNISPKTDRIINQYKKSAKNIYNPGNTINHMNNNNLMSKIGINIRSFISPVNSVKQIKVKGSSNKKINNNIKRNYIKNKKNEIMKNNRIINISKEKNKINIAKNSKNMHSNKNINEINNKTSVIETSNTKNLKRSEIIAPRENTASLNKTIKEIKIKKKEMSHSFSSNKLLLNEEKKEKENILHNNQNQLNNSNNIKNISIERPILKSHSPKNNKKNIEVNVSPKYIKNINDKSNSDSRNYINNKNNSKNNDLSLNKSKSFASDKKTINEINEIKEIFKSNKLYKKEGINCYIKKRKNNHIYRKNFLNNDKNCVGGIKYVKKNKNRNSEIYFRDSKNKNSSFQNMKEDDILTKTVNLNQNQIKNNFILDKNLHPINKNKNLAKNKTGNTESAKLIFQKNNNNYFINNKTNFYSQDELKIKINKLNQYKNPLNNLSISSIIKNKNKNKNKKKVNSNSAININSIKDKTNDNNKGYISVINKDYNNNRKSIDDKVKEQNNRNIIFSYKNKTSKFK